MELKTYTVGNWYTCIQKRLNSTILNEIMFELNYPMKNALIEKGQGLGKNQKPMTLGTKNVPTKNKLEGAGFCDRAQKLCRPLPAIAEESE